MFIPIDVKSLSRQALRGYGPEDPEPLPERGKRWWPSADGPAALDAGRAGLQPLARLGAQRPVLGQVVAP